MTRTITLDTTATRRRALRFAAIATALFGLTMLTAGVADAQGRGRGKGGHVPPGHLPPEGQCRVWHDGRPPGHQPAPTSCTQAQYDAARTGGRVLYGGGKSRRYDKHDRHDRYENRGDRGVLGGVAYPERAPSVPEMIWGVLMGRGQRVDGASRWLGDAPVRPRYADANRDGTPERITWYDGGGRVVQQWMDDDRDGRADRVGYYRDGRLVRVVRP